MSVFNLNENDLILADEFQIGEQQNDDGEIEYVAFRVKSTWSGALLHRSDDPQKLMEMASYLVTCAQRISSRLDSEKASIEKPSLGNSAPRKAAKNHKAAVKGSLVPRKKMNATGKSAVKKAKKR